MKNLRIILFVVLYWVVNIVAAVLFGMKAVALILLASCCVSVLSVLLKNDEPDEESEPEHESCAGCANHLGGGHCRISVEGECREGGGFELYEPEEG